MPIIYMHGVNTRDPNHFKPVKEYLQRIVAPAIARDPENVSIRPADWFKYCDPPKWGGIARPRTELTGQGAQIASAEVLDAIVKKAQASGVAPSSGLMSGQEAASPSARIDGLSDEDLADLIAASVAQPGMNDLQRAQIGVAADRAARDPDVRSELKSAASLDKQLEIVAAKIQQDVDASSNLAAAGVGDVLRRLKDRISESLSRASSAPAVGATILVGELRPTLNDFVTRFLGDVMFYMTGRGAAAAPGPIPKVLVDELNLAQANKQERGGEPIVLLTHSMGGQIAYDTVATFLPTARSDVKVDFWCATASQVGFFEELNMFLASSPDYSKATGKRTPFPASNLGRWWNVWDHNDILSFSTKGIFADNIDDEEYWTGMSVAAAHGGYLERPSFYRGFADKLKAAFPGRS